MNLVGLLEWCVNKVLWMQMVHPEKGNQGSEGAPGKHLTRRGREVSLEHSRSSA